MVFFVLSFPADFQDTKEYCFVYCDLNLTVRLIPNRSLVLGRRKFTLKKLRM